MEREVMLTGIGGQGIQLCAQVLARAATLEGRHVMLFGLYGGTMRGGNTESTVVVADGPIDAPPIVSRAGSAIAMHHAYFAPLREKLRPGAVLLLNSTLFEGGVDRDRCRVFEVPAGEVATSLGSPMSASMVMLGSYAAITGLVGIEALCGAMAASLPPYRRQHVEANEKALRAGCDRGPAGAAPAWAEPA